MKTSLYILLVLLFSAFGNGESFAQKGKIKLTVQDKREIIKLALQNLVVLQKSNLPKDLGRNLFDETLFLSTENIPKEIQGNFPKIKNLKLNLISPESTDNYDVSFYFLRFEKYKREARIYLIGEYKPGCWLTLQHTFWKSNSKWKFKFINHFKCGQIKSISS